MGKGGPQPAHQVRPGDLQLEEAVLDLEDPEIFGHLVVPMSQLLSSKEASPLEESIREALGDDDDDDDVDDDHLRDVDEETTEEHASVCEGPSMIRNLNNNAKKSRKSVLHTQSARKQSSVVLYHVDVLLQELIYSDRRSKWEPAEKENEFLMKYNEFMNKTHNNKYLRSIQEEDEESKEQKDENCQEKEEKNKADPVVPAGDGFNGAAPKKRFNGGRRQGHGLWRNKVCDTSGQLNPCQQVNMCGDYRCDYKELRKGMGDVMDDLSGPDNLATSSENDKAEVNMEARDCQSSEDCKLSVGPSTLDEMDHTTVADFSSFLEPGYSCWNAERASQTTLVDEETLSSALSSQKDKEKAVIHEEADKLSQTKGEILTPHDDDVCFREHLTKDNINGILEDQKQISNIPCEINISVLSFKEEKNIRVPQNKSSDERLASELPHDCQMAHGSAKTSFPSVANSCGYTGSIPINYEQRDNVRTTSQLISLVKESKIDKTKSSWVSKYNCVGTCTKSCKTIPISRCTSSNITEAQTFNLPNPISDDDVKSRQGVYAMTYKISSENEKQKAEKDDAVLAAEKKQLPSLPTDNELLYNDTGNYDVVARQGTDFVGKNGTPTTPLNTGNILTKQKANIGSNYRPIKTGSSDGINSNTGRFSNNNDANVDKCNRLQRGSLHLNSREIKSRQSNRLSEIPEVCSGSYNADSQCCSAIPAKADTEKSGDDSFPGRKISPTGLTQYSSENVTQNHTSSQSQEDSPQAMGGQIKRRRGKTSKGSFTKRTSFNRTLNPETIVAEANKVIQRNMTVFENTVIVSKHRTQGVNDTFVTKPRNAAEDEQERPREDQPLTCIRSCVSRTFSVHNNTKPTTCSVQSQTPGPHLAPASIQCRISESKCVAEDTGTATHQVSNFATMDIYRTASNRVLSKLVVSKRSQLRQDSVRTSVPTSNVVKARITSVHYGREMSSLKKSPINVSFPQIGESVSACSKPNLAQTGGECFHVNSRQLQATPTTHDNLNNGLFHQGNKLFSYNLTRDLSNRFSASSVVTKKHSAALQTQARSSMALYFSRLNASHNTKANANLNSTSSPFTQGEQDQDEVTVIISSDNMTLTDAQISSATSSKSKIPASSTITTPPERNMGLFSSFGSRFFRSSSPTRESSVDGEWYPVQRIILPSASSAQDQASQTHEGQVVYPSDCCWRKEPHHYSHRISDCRQGLGEDQATQTHERTALRNNVNTLLAPDDLSNRYNIDMPSTSASRGRQTQLPRTQDEDFQVHKHAQTNIRTVRSQNTKDNIYSEQDSYYVRKIPADDRFKDYDENKWETTKQQQQAQKKVQSHYYTQKEWKPGMPIDRQRSILNEASFTTGRNLEDTQQLPPLRSERFYDERTTYRDTFQDPAMYRSYFNVLDSSTSDLEPARMSQKNMLLKSSLKVAEAQSFGPHYSPNMSPDNQTTKRTGFPNEAFSYAQQNKLRDQDSFMVYGPPEDKKRKSVSFDSRLLLPSMRDLPSSDDTYLSTKLRRSKTLPPSYSCPNFNGVFGDFMSSYKQCECPDKWGLSYRASGQPTSMLERRKFDEHQLLPARLLADSYYDPSNNVISVVVKPINVSLNQRLRNIKVKVYRSPPLLPPLRSASKQEKQTSRKRMQPSVPVSRNIIDRRAGNPPFNTTTSGEANQRYNSMFAHWKIQ